MVGNLLWASGYNNKSTYWTKDIKFILVVSLTFSAAFKYLSIVIVAIKGQLFKLDK